MLLNGPRTDSARFVDGDVSVPLASIRSVRVSDDPWAELRGMRYPGTRLPRVVALGTWRHSLGRDFVAVYGKGPGGRRRPGRGTLRAARRLDGRDAERLAAEVTEAARELQALR